ncbi:retrovirus-related pol polyprotein from transposon TNT 1-94 [Tanacetum coccineum]
MEQAKTTTPAIQSATTEVPPFSSSHTVSSNYTSAFLNLENLHFTEPEVVSMLDINVQHEVPHTSPLLTIHVSIILEHTVFNPSKIVTTTSATTISSILSSLFPSLQQSTSIPTPTTTEATTSIIVVPDSETLNALHQIIVDLEKDVKELKDVDNSTKVISTIKFEVPNAVKEYLRSSLDDALHKVIQINFTDIIKEHSVPAEIVDRLRQQYAPQKSIKDIREIKMEHARKQQSFNKSPKHGAIYHALIESILKDEEAMDKGDADELKKRKQDDTDKDEDPSDGSDRDFDKAEHDDNELDYADMPMDQGEDLGNTDEQPSDEVVHKNNWYKKSSSDTSPNPEWNKGKSINDGPKQSWLNDMAKATKPPPTFNELMHTPIDFSAFVMNRLKIDNLTKEILVGPDYNLLKGTCKTNFFFNNDLEYLRGGSSDKKYTASTTKSKVARNLLLANQTLEFLWLYDQNSVQARCLFEQEDIERYQCQEGDFKRLYLNNIEDMLLLIVQKKLNNLDGNAVVHLVASLRMFARRTVIQERVEDLQLGVESYQKKLNVTKPRTQDVDMSRRLAYTTLSNLQDSHHGPSDAIHNPPQPLKVSQKTLVSFLTEIKHISIDFLTPKHQTDTKVFTMTMEILSEPTSTSSALVLFSIMFPAAVIGSADVIYRFPPKHLLESLTTHAYYTYSSHPLRYPYPNSSASPSFTQDDTVMPNPSASPSFTQDDTFMPEPIQPMPTFTQTSFSQPAVHPLTNSNKPDWNTIVHPPVSLDEHVAVQWVSVGNEESKKMKKTMLKQQFAEFSVTEEEGLHKGYDRFQKILSQLNQVQARPDNDDINLKFLRALPSSWSQVALALKTRGGLESMSFDDLYNKLRSLELDVRIGHSYGVKVAAAPTHSAFIGTACSGSKPTFILISKLVLFPSVSQTLSVLDKCNVKTVDDKARYSAFKVTEVKTDEPKALVSVDSMVNWSDHAAENKTNEVAKVYGMMAGLDADNNGADISNAADEFAMMGISPKAYQHAVKTLESQKDSPPGDSSTDNDIGLVDQWLLKKLMKEKQGKGTRLAAFSTIKTALFAALSSRNGPSLWIRNADLCRRGLLSFKDKNMKAKEQTARIMVNLFSQATAEKYVIKLSWTIRNQGVSAVMDSCWTLSSVLRITDWSLDSAVKDLLALIIALLLTGSVGPADKEQTCFRTTSIAKGNLRIMIGVDAYAKRDAISFINKQGHRQEEGIDYDECFLYGEIEEEVYVTQPKGFEDPYFPKHVYRVVKALYGLHQTLGAWFMRMTSSFGSYPINPGCVEFDGLIDQVNLKWSAMGRENFFFRSTVVLVPGHQVTPQTSHLNAVRKTSMSVYAGSHGDRKSTTRWCQFLGRRLISWQCKMQTICGYPSSTEDRVTLAAASCCAQVFWISEQTAGLWHHFIRDANEKNLIQVLKIHTDDNVADLLTKAFDGPRFAYLVVHIGMVDIPLSCSHMLLGVLALVVILPAGRMVSAGWSMVLLVVIVPAGFFVPAGSYGLLSNPAGGTMYLLPDACVLVTYQATRHISILLIDLVLLISLRLVTAG